MEPGKIFFLNNQRTAWGPQRQPGAKGHEVDAPAVEIMRDAAPLFHTLYIDVI